MGITARSGPDVVYGVTTTSTGGVSEYNEERGPSLYDMGYGIMDPRPFYSYDPGAAVGSQVAGLYLGRGFVDYVPAAQSSNGIAVSSNQAALTVSGALTLRTTNAAFIPTTIVPPEGGAAASVFAIDSTAAVLRFPSSAGAGQVGGSVVMWNPAAGTGRCIRVTTTTCGVGSVTVVGRDMYGYKMSQTINIGDLSTSYGIASSDTSVYNWVTTKAFKYITAVSVSTVGGVAAVTSTGVNVGYIDTYGYPLLLSYFSYDNWQGMYTSSTTLATLSTAGTITFGTTTTAVSTAGDVRGTWMSSLISDGTRRVQMFQTITSPRMWNITSSDTAASALFGVTQSSSV